MGESGGSPMDLPHLSHHEPLLWGRGGLRLREGAEIVLKVIEDRQVGKGMESKALASNLYNSIPSAPFPEGL